MIHALAAMGVVKLTFHLTIEWEDICTGREKVAGRAAKKHRKGARVASEQSVLIALIDLEDIHT